MRFSTDGLPEDRRAEAVRKLHLQERTILSPGLEPIEPLEPLPDDVPHVNLTKRTLPGLAVVSGTLSGLRQLLRSAADAEDDLLLGVNVSGCSAVRQRDRDLTLRDGDAFVTTRDARAIVLMRPTPVRFVGCRVPRQAVAPLVGRIDDIPLRLVPPSAEALILLVTYARAIADAFPLETPALQRLAVTHMHDLIAATIGATRDRHAIAERRGISAARLRLIMTDISANLGDGDLSVAEIARRHRVTPRYVHKLFENEGLTVSSFILGQRLLRAHRMLSDPQFADRNISSIAFDVGFGDLSYFNRAFRRCYAATPSDIRHLALTADTGHR
ncbi:helix-turn-helix transcriptional regulator [Paraburkholderia youngii]|uniref:helix-turn-helix transcriptional regulator n=1 Tax=Paraburkholderia youngii TaxID=2782701 RepID=UPI003D23B507